MLTRINVSGILAPMTPPDHLTLSVVPDDRRAIALPTQRPSQRQLAELWINILTYQAKAGDKSHSLLKGYTQNVGEWLAFLDDRRTEIHDQPGTAHVLEWLGELQKPYRNERGEQMPPRKAATINRYLTAVRSFYNWTAQTGAYPNIAREAKGPRVTKDGALECLTMEQVAELVRLAKGDKLSAKRDYAILHVLFCTAIRCVSLCEANVGDLDLDTGALVFRNKGTRDKSGRAVLSDSALAAVRDYLNDRSQFEGHALAADAPLFAGVGNRSLGKRLDERTVNRMVAALMERAGHVKRAEGKIIRPRVFSVHSLRRSAITAVYEQDGLEVAQILAHHASPATTTRSYVRANKAKYLKRSARTLDLGAMLQEAV
jgi:integrase/recombinase XerC